MFIRGARLRMTTKNLTVTPSDVHLSGFKSAWQYYVEWADTFDIRRERDVLEQMDTILVFVPPINFLFCPILTCARQSGLFAAFLSAFLIETLKRLEEDPSETTRDILIYQTLMMRNTTLGPFQPQPFEPPGHIVVVNILLFASLALILVAAFVSILVKGWIREFDRGLKDILNIKQRAIVREYRAQGFERYKLSQIIALLPLLIYSSLLLFSIGLVTFLLFIHRPSAIVMILILGVGVLFYVFTLITSILDPSAPFPSPISRYFAFIFQHIWESLPRNRWYITWVFLSHRHNLLQGISAAIARRLLWKPCTEDNLGLLDDARPLQDDEYHVTLSALGISCSVLNQVFSLPEESAHRSAVLASDPRYQTGSIKLLRSNMGSPLSLHGARSIASMASFDNFHTLPREEREQLMITLLKESSDLWDIVLAQLVYADAGFREFGFGGDLKTDYVTKNALDLIQSRPKEFNFSYISLISTSIRRHISGCSHRDNNCQNHHIAMWAAAARMFTTFMRYRSLCVTELALVLAQFQMICTTRDDYRRLWRHRLLDAFMNQPVNHESSDKPFLPYLHHGYTLIKAISLLDSFPEFIQFLHDRPHSPAIFRAFAIQFLICLYDKSRVLYERVVDRISSQEVEEWASEALDGQDRSLSGVILHKLGRLEGLSHLPDSELWQEVIERYDRSLDPLTLDLNKPLVHALYHAIGYWGIRRGSLALGNIWLALHAQTADRGINLPIPEENIQWVDHPISEMIALKRLETFSGHKHTFLILFFHSSSFDVLLRALKEYVPNLLMRYRSLNHWVSWLEKRKTLSEGFPASLSNALRILLDPDVPVDHVSSVWSQIYHLYDEVWVGVSNAWQTGFVRTFFSEADGSNNKGISKFLGIRWMEAVWQRVLKRRIREVVIRHADLRWAGFGSDEGYQLNPLTARKEYRERNLNRSGTILLGVLATFLEAAASSGFVTVGLAADISTSNLFKDDKLRQDQEALNRIEAIIHPLLISLPETPPTSNVELPSVDDRTADSTQPDDNTVRYLNERPNPALTIPSLLSIRT